jgi:hypothetical protein
VAIISVSFAQICSRQIRSRQIRRHEVRESPPFEFSSLGLDSSNLSIGVLSGNVELRNLKFKRNVLEGIQLPVSVKVLHYSSFITRCVISNEKKNVLLTSMN